MLGSWERITLIATALVLALAVSLRFSLLMPNPTANKLVCYVLSPPITFRTCWLDQPVNTVTQSREGPASDHGMTT